MIILKSKPQIVVQITGKTKAKMFGNLKVGDKVQFSIPIKFAGSNRGRTYASYVKCINLSTDEYTEMSFNQLPNILENFELSNEN